MLRERKFIILIMDWKIKNLLISFWIPKRNNSLKVIRIR